MGGKDCKTKGASILPGSQPECLFELLGEQEFPDKPYLKRI
jgi:hypothetical protein